MGVCVRDVASDYVPLLTTARFCLLVRRHEGVEASNSASTSLPLFSSLIIFPLSFYSSFILFFSFSSFFYSFFLYFFSLPSFLFSYFRLYFFFFFLSFFSSSFLFLFIILFLFPHFFTYNFFSNLFPLPHVFAFDAPSFDL